MLSVRIADMNYYEATRPDREDYMIEYQRKEVLCWGLNAAIGSSVIEGELSTVVDIPEDLYDFAIKILHENRYSITLLTHNDKSIIVRISWDFEDEDADE